MGKDNGLTRTETQVDAVSDNGGLYCIHSTKISGDGRSCSGHDDSERKLLSGATPSTTTTQQWTNRVWLHASRNVLTRLLPRSASLGYIHWDTSNAVSLKVWTIGVGTRVVGKLFFQPPEEQIEKTRFAYRPILVVESYEDNDEET